MPVWQLQRILYKRDYLNPAESLEPDGALETHKLVVTTNEAAHYAKIWCVSFPTTWCRFDYIVFKLKSIVKSSW